MIALLWMSVMTAAQTRTSGAQPKLEDSVKKLAQWTVNDEKASYHLRAEGPMPVALWGMVFAELDATPGFARATFTNTDKRASEAKARRGEEGYDLAKALALMVAPSLGVILDCGAAAAHTAGVEQLGGRDTEKYDFDTVGLPQGQQPSTRAECNVDQVGAKILSVRGTAWIERSTGRLIKLDATMKFAEEGKPVAESHPKFEVIPK